MKLILIHGRDQQGCKPEVLKKEWITAWEIGLSKSNLELPVPISKIEFPYYGDLLKNMTDEAYNPVYPRDIVRSGTLSKVNTVEQYEFMKAFAKDVSENTNLTQEGKDKLDKLMVKERGLLNWEPLQSFLAYLDSKEILGKTMINYFTRDVFVYLSTTSVRRQVNELVEKSFSEDEPCVVVAHSLGTVVNYLILDKNPQYKVQKLITVGSPLGLKSIQDLMKTSIRMPECIKNGWFNAFDQRDVVALNPLDKAHFNVRPPIENKSDVDNKTDNRHGISGYLNDKVVAKQIYYALNIR